MWFWSQTPWPSQPAVVHALLSVSGHGTLSCSNMWFCAHTPRSGLVGLSSQPAIVHTLPSVSVHGVLTFGVQLPLVASQPPLYSSAGGHVLLAWVWWHTPAPLQPAVVQALRSLSWHDVHSVANVSLSAHTPAAGSVGLASQPASVHTLPSVSVHGWLTNGVDTHVPALGLVVSSGHSLVVHASPAQGTGHWGMA